MGLPVAPFEGLFGVDMVWWMRAPRGEAEERDRENEPGDTRTKRQAFGHDLTDVSVLCSLIDSPCAAERQKSSWLGVEDDAGLSHGR